MGPRGMRKGSVEGSTERDLRSLYLSPNLLRGIKSRRLRWACYVARMEEGRSAFKILTDTNSGKIPSGRLRRRLEDNIRIDFKEMGINKRNWVNSAQNRDYWRSHVNATLYSQVS